MFSTSSYNEMSLLNFHVSILSLVAALETPAPVVTHQVVAEAFGEAERDRERIDSRD